MKSKKSCSMTSVLILMILLLSFFVSSLLADSVETSTPNPEYKKTCSIAISAPSLIFLGPVVEMGYEGLGPVGFYGSFGYSSYGVSIAALEDKSNTSLYGLGGGVAVKFYYNYKKKYHDSGYFGAQCYYSHMNAKDSGGNVLKYHGLFGHFITGWRWQWSLVYLDLSLGLGYGRYFKAEGVALFDTSSKAEIDKNINKSYSGIFTGNLIVGIAF